MQRRHMHGLSWNLILDANEWGRGSCQPPECSTGRGSHQTTRGLTPKPNLSPAIHPWSDGRRKLSCMVSTSCACVKHVVLVSYSLVEKSQVAGGRHGSSDDKSSLTRLVGEINFHFRRLLTCCLAVPLKCRLSGKLVM